MTVFQVQNEIRKKWQNHSLHRSGSWRSQPSFASFLRRSVQTGNKGGRFKSQSRSFLDSTVSHSVGSHSPTSPTANGHLAPICEETAPLNESGSHETSVQVCIRQDYNDNRTDCVAADDGGDCNDADAEFGGGDVDACGDAECRGDVRVCDGLECQDEAAGPCGQLKFADDVKSDQKEDSL